MAQAAKADGVALLEVADFTALPGRGVSGRIDGETYHLGNHRMLEELGHCTPELEQRISAMEIEGKTVVMLVCTSGAQALIAVADTIKDSSTSAIGDLHALGIKTMMLTGDNPHTAQAIARQAGIDRAQALNHRRTGFARDGMGEGVGTGRQVSLHRLAARAGLEIGVDLIFIQAHKFIQVHKFIRMNKMTWRGAGGGFSLRKPGPYRPAAVPARGSTACRQTGNKRPSRGQP